MPANKAWKRRKPDRRPWTQQEDAAIIDMVEIGLCVNQCSIAYKRIMPDRRFGDIVDRKGQLIEQGKAHRPPPI